MEFSVNMSCGSCAETIKRSLQANGKVDLVSLDVAKQLVVVKSNLNSFEVKDILESSGKKAALIGSGKLGAAVAEITGKSAKGVIRLSQLSEDKCLVEGIVDGLAPGRHGLNIHEYGDLSDGCNSCGDHFNPGGLRHGARTDPVRHYGDLGNIEADSEGRANFRFVDEMVKVWDVIGRSMVVHASGDDLGKGEDAKSKVTGNSGLGVACAIIARSSGLFQNSKRLCTCDGVSVWDERNVPVVGQARQQFAQKL